MPVYVPIFHAFPMLPILNSPSTWIPWIPYIPLLRVLRVLRIFRIFPILPILPIFPAFRWAAHQQVHRRPRGLRRRAGVLTQRTLRVLGFVQSWRGEGPRQALGGGQLWVQSRDPSGGTLLDIKTAWASMDGKSQCSRLCSLMEEDGGGWRRMGSSEAADGRWSVCASACGYACCGRLLVRVRTYTCCGAMHAGNIPHGTMPFSGTRYTLVYFTQQFFRRTQHADRMHLSQASTLSWCCVHSAQSPKPPSEIQ